jgi:predicted kinase
VGSAQEDPEGVAQGLQARHPAVRLLVNEIMEPLHGMVENRAIMWRGLQLRGACRSGLSESAGRLKAVRGLIHCKLGS